MKAPSSKINCCCTTTEIEDADTTSPMIRGSFHIDERIRANGSLLAGCPQRKSCPILHQEEVYCHTLSDDSTFRPNSGKGSIRNHFGPRYAMALFEQGQWRRRENGVQETFYLRGFN